MWAGLPCQRIWPSVGCHSPEIVLIVTDLPAPLSPTSAVILPAGTERLTLSSACTAPNDLLTPRSSRSGTSSVMWWPPSRRQLESLHASSGRPPPRRRDRGSAWKLLRFDGHYPDRRAG